MSKKFSDIISQIITDETPFLNEHNSITDEFAKTTGANINSYIQGKLKDASSAALSTLDKIIFFKNSETLAKTVTLGDLATFLGTGGGGSNNVCWVSQTDINADYSSFAEAKAAGKYIFIVKDTYVDNIELTANCIILNFGEITTNLSECIVIGGDKETNKIILTETIENNIFLSVLMEAAYNISGNYCNNSNITIIDDISVSNSIIENCRISGSHTATFDTNNNIENNKIFSGVVFSFSSEVEERNKIINNTFSLCDFSMYGENGLITSNDFFEVTFYFPSSFSNSNFSNNIFQFCSVDSSFSTNYDVDSIVMTGNVGQLEFAERLSSGKIWKGGSNNTPEEVDFPIGFYDATIGIGGDYETLEDVLNAIESGIRFFKAVGNVSNSTGLTTKTLTKSAYIMLDDYYIDFGNVQIGGYGGANITIIGITNNAKIKYSSPTNYTFYGFWKIKLENVIIEPQAAKVLIQDSTVYLEKITINQYNGNSHIFVNTSGIIRNINFVGGGTSCRGGISSSTSTTQLYIENITFSGTYANNGTILSLLRGKIINMNYNSSSIVGAIVYNIENITNTQKTLYLDVYTGGIIKQGNVNYLHMRTNSIAEKIETEHMDFVLYDQQNITLKECIINQAVTQTKVLERQKYFNCVFKGNIIMLGNNNIFENNKMEGNFTYSGDYGTITQNRITGATTLQSGSEYNIITENWFTGGLTNNSGNTTNELQNNI